METGGSTELVCLHSLSWGIGRNSPVLGTGEIKLPTNMNLLFFLVFMVISPGLPFFDVGCAYPVDQPQPRCWALHLAVSLLCQAAKDALTTFPAVSHFPLIPAASNQLPQHAPRPLRLRGRARTRDTSACSLTASTRCCIKPSMSQVCCAGLDLCLPGTVGRVLGPCCPMNNEQSTLRVLWVL